MKNYIFKSIYIFLITMPYTMPILIRGNTLSSGCATAIKIPSLSLSLSARLLLVATEVCLSKVSLQTLLFKTSTYTSMDNYTTPGKKTLSAWWEHQKEQRASCYRCHGCAVRKKAHIWIRMLLKILKRHKLLGYKQNSRERRSLDCETYLNNRGCDRQLRYFESIYCGGYICHL